MVGKLLSHLRCLVTVLNRKIGVLGRATDIVTRTVYLSLTYLPTYLLTHSLIRVCLKVLPSPYLR